MDEANDTVNVSSIYTGTPRDIPVYPKKHRFKFHTATLVQSLMSSGDNLGGSFIFLYAISRGSVGVLQGLITAIRELGSALFQPIWGNLSDKFGRRPFLVLGFLVQALFWGVFIPLSVTPLQILLVLLFQTLLGTMVIPSFNGWLGDFTERTTRGRIIGKVGMISSWMALFALLLVSIIMQIQDPNRLYVSTYSLAFIVGAGFYVLAAIVSLFLPERERKSPQSVFTDSLMSSSGQSIQSKYFIRFKIKFDSYIAGFNPEFKRLVIVEGIFKLGWAIAWPLFPYATLDATNGWIEIAVLQITIGISLGISQMIGGTISDKIGRKRVIIWSRLSLIFPPLLAGLAMQYQNIWFLIFSNLLVGLTLGAGTIGLNAMILDIAPEGREGKYFSNFLMLQGLISFSASFIMGLILNLFDSTAPNFYGIIAWLLISVSFLRFLLWFVYFFLPDL